MASAEDLAPGLYLVATPIGNLEDITLRAIRILKQADLIACEDTRQTQKLLNHYGIDTPTISYHEHNEAGRAAELVEKLAHGSRIAVVSDAGTPGISDPGFRLVSLAAAFVSAMVASGLPSEAFSFRGFLPPKSAARRQELEEVRPSARTAVFYEAPHRILAALEDVLAVLGPRRRIVVARELTKIHEEFLRGTAAQVLDIIKGRGEMKGEIVLAIGPVGEEENPAPTISIRDRVEELMRQEHLEEKAALKKAAKERGMSKSAAYREFQILK